MTAEEGGVTNAAFAIAEICGRDIAALDQFEGRLLVAAGGQLDTSPAEIANSTSIDRAKVVDVFRQLRRAGAVERSSVGAGGEQARYYVRSGQVRRIFRAARTVVEFLETHEERSPPESRVEPLVTFPEDPSFAEASPYDFEMKWLMPTLTSAIKESVEGITIVTPFFDQTGFETLQPHLIDTLERGTSLRIITRYLGDRSSYNRRVLASFVTSLSDAGVSRENLTFIDYTVWDPEVPMDERRQDGKNPAFTLHAKLMLFDDREAYLGSANVTDYGFDRYLELGVLISGPPVADFSRLVSFLVDSEAATTVDIPPRD